MRENKLKPVLITAQNPQSFVDFGQKSVGRILSRKPKPTAVVAGNDEIAYGPWRLLQRHAIKVPDDISLVGFDDREEAALMDPPLSTVRVHFGENLYEDASRAATSSRNGLQSPCSAHGIRNSRDRPQAVSVTPGLTTPQISTEWIESVNPEDHTILRLLREGKGNLHALIE
jgi:hypothetical protein